MKTVLVTGAKGFIGRNLIAHLKEKKDVRILPYDLDGDWNQLRIQLSEVDIIFHLAGINRPQKIQEFEEGNAGFTKHLCESLQELGCKPKMIMTSSIQASLDNPYGISKRHAEDAVRRYSCETGGSAVIYRLKNVFGKWCRPNYNSVTATFCHNIAHDLPISISDPQNVVDLVYIDDVVKQMLDEMNKPPAPVDCLAEDTIPSTRITLGDLAGRIQAYHDMRSNLMVPDFSERFNQCLYASYLSYVEPENHESGLDVKSDARGNLAEFIKSQHFGQIFVSRTRPGITRGNHYHHTKTEKFFVVAGEGLIRMRSIEGGEIIEYLVHGEQYRVVDIPPGYTHSITNTGEDEMITLFWASEVFDPDKPDTYFMEI
jgi:UDP-2-acetamido-2,6-beta-L-arabino-hexul-4-ose reductase